MPFFPGNSWSSTSCLCFAKHSCAPPMSGSFCPFRSTLHQSCSMKLCRHSEQPWPPPKRDEEGAETQQIQVTDSAGELGQREPGIQALYLILCSENGISWTPHCSVQCSGHLLHQRSFRLSPEAVVRKKPQKTAAGKRKGRRGMW